MKRANLNDLAQYVEQWKRAGPELERIRREELQRWEYDWETVDDLLDMGDRFGQPRATTGMVEMQRWFMKLAERLRLKHGAARGADTEAEKSR